MKVLYFDRHFEPKQEFIDYISSLGYKYWWNNLTLKTDPRVIKFVEDRLEILWGNDHMYKGRESYNYRIGFAGAAIVLDVDETRKWDLKFTQTDYPIVRYVDVLTDVTGYTRVVEAKED